MEKENISKIRHSLSHLMTMAVLEIYPTAKLGVGPVIENGFYQDYDLPEKISDQSLQRLEQRMKELIKEKIDFKQREVSFEEALKMYREDPYKTELINDLKTAGEKNVSFYDSGNFSNLCAGPHVSNTKEIPKDAFKLERIAGAYWRGDEKNKMLTRIYGLAFESKADLEAYIKKIEEAKARDHKKLGKEMGLFVFSDLVGPGLPLFTFKGAAIRREIINYSNELQKSIGYQEVHTPNINKAELFKVSGHYEKYREDMLKVISNYSKEEYFLKPMNCPQHTQLFAAQPRTYKELPMRIADFANLYRDERPGELSGLTRLRCFCQDDAHAFCREDQIKQEFKNVLEIVKKALKTYKMENYKIRLSLWDPNKREKYLGEPDVWEKSQTLLEEILIENKIDYIKAPGEAAIYGPKMDIVTQDSIGREWQISTIQLDLIMPVRFGLKYIDKDGKEKTPVMIHRAIIGSPERFMGILIEHYAGNFPVWLSPVQIKIIPVRENHNDYAKKIADELRAINVRVEFDDSDEGMGKKIRAGKVNKIPYMLVIGDKEIESGELALEIRDGEKKENISLENLKIKLQKEITERL